MLSLSSKKNNPLFPSRPLDDLENMLLDEFAGKTLTMSEVYEQHKVNIDQNYCICVLLPKNGNISNQLVR